MGHLHRFARATRRRVRQRAAIRDRAAGPLLATVARLVCGTRARWSGCAPAGRQRIYFGNHTSHLDFLALWAALPAEIRARVRPVAGRDYWDRGVIRRYLARRVFRAVLVDRAGRESRESRSAMIARARRSVERAARALARGDSLIIFPEGTRGDGSGVGTFKSGLYHLCLLHPDVELVPVWLENMHRILPEGSMLPVPIAGSVTFGRPLRLAPQEDKDTFLARARRALLAVNQPCTCSPTLSSRAF